MTFRVRAKGSDAACPACRHRSSRVHARYQRQLADLPLGGRPVRIIVHVRRFKCANPRCAQSTFSEQIPGLTTPFARRTPPLTGALADVALALAGRPGSRLAAKLAMPCCRDVLIRLIRAQPVPAAGRIDVLGVDDFAIRRGQSYNTILIDMDTHRPVDVLSGRESETLAAWVRGHPEIQVVCRDRAVAYAEGIRAGAPQAIQVADRFHLWKNLCEAAEKTVAAHHHCLRAAAAPAQAAPAEPEPRPPAPAAAAGTADPPARTRRLAERTRARYAEVQECLARGLSRAAVSRELDLDIQTVRRFANAACAEEVLGKAEHRVTKLDPYIDLVNQRWNEGVTNAAAIAAELRTLGFKGDAQAIRRYLRPFRLPGTSPSHPDPRRRRPPPRHPGRPQAPRDQQGAAHPPRPPQRGRRADREERHRRMRPPRTPPPARPVLRQDHGPAPRPGTARLAGCRRSRRPARTAQPRRWHPPRPGRRHQRAHPRAQLRRRRGQRHSCQAAQTRRVRKSELRPPQTSDTPRRLTGHHVIIARAE